MYKRQVATAAISETVLSIVSGRLILNATDKSPSAEPIILSLIHIYKNAVFRWKFSTKFYKNVDNDDFFVYNRKVHYLSLIHI